MERLDEFMGERRENGGRTRSGKLKLLCRISLQRVVIVERVQAVFGENSVEMAIGLESQPSHFVVESC